MVRQVAALLVLAACAGGHTTGTTPPTGSGSGSGPGSAPAPPAVIDDGAQLEPHVGQPVVARGMAGNAHIAAAVKVGSEVVYCLGLDSWPDAVSGKTVDASGKLERTNEFAAPPPGPNGEQSQGTDGDVYVLRDCKYTVR